MLKVDSDWRKRMTLRDVRYAIESVDHFYSDDVEFEGSMARCSLEVDMRMDNVSLPSKLNFLP